MDTYTPQIDNQSSLECDQFLSSFSRIWSPSVKQLFPQTEQLEEQIRNRKVTIRSINRYFPLRRSLVNACGESILYGEQCKHKITQDYSCITCTIDKHVTSTPYFCLNCFEIEKHHGHHFQKHTNHSQLFVMMCDCGKGSSAEAKSFCHRHRSTEIIGYNIDDQNGSRFLSLFEGLLQIEAYFQIKEIQSNIVQQVTRFMVPLLRNSVYYTRLLTKILIKPINFLAKPMSILECLQINLHDLSQLLWFLHQDIASMVQLGLNILAKKSYIMFRQPIAEIIRSREFLRQIKKSHQSLRIAYTLRKPSKSSSKC